MPSPAPTPPPEPVVEEVKPKKRAPRKKAAEKVPDE
jgi:hypothetical protein